MSDQCSFCAIRSAEYSSQSTQLLFRQSRKHLLSSAVDCQGILWHLAFLFSFREQQLLPWCSAMEALPVQWLPCGKIMKRNFCQLQWCLQSFSCYSQVPLWRFCLVLFASSQLLVTVATALNCLHFWTVCQTVVWWMHNHWDDFVSLSSLSSFMQISYSWSRLQIPSFCEGWFTSADASKQQP